MKKQMVFVDAEANGLYGGFLTVGMLAVDEAGAEIERAYYGIARENMKVTDEWTRENVLPVLGEYEACEDETELLEKVWAFWMRYEQVSYAAADVIYPVEARLFAACVEQSPAERIKKAPYPLIDISSLLLAKGFKPLADRKELIMGSEEKRQHNAMDDAEISALVWKKLFLEEE